MHRGLVAAVALSVATPCALRAQPEPRAVEDIRRELTGLPNYGVFDVISFDYEKGSVTLGGYVHDPSLRGAAEKAVARVEGVEQVTNRINVLPNLASDTDLRWQIYYAIYRNSALSRYGSATDERAASRPEGMRGPEIRRGPAPPPRDRPFPEVEPIGFHAIHIIVYQGNVMLSGVVDRTEDKQLAEVKARGILGVRKVVNELTVSGSDR